jgi:hypothetical protein
VAAPFTGEKTIKKCSRPRLSRGRLKDTKKNDINKNLCALVLLWQTAFPGEKTKKKSSFCNLKSLP